MDHSHEYQDCGPVLQSGVCILDFPVRILPSHLRSDERWSDVGSGHLISEYLSLHVLLEYFSLDRK